MAADTPSMKRGMEGRFGMIALTPVMESLSKKRPVFHSEADFQHALAWEIHSLREDARVYVEKPCPLEQKHAHVDIVAEWGERRIACEVKYYTKRLGSPYDDFRLKDQGAQDCGRYDFLWDLFRMERIVASAQAAVGCVVLLTNDSLYWHTPRPRRTATMDAALRIHEGATVRGTLFWGDKASPGSMRGRDEKIPLGGAYACRWEDYSRVGDKPGDEFKYLLLAVGK
jgi:hypothetical protein